VNKQRRAILPPTVTTKPPTDAPDDVIDEVVEQLDREEAAFEREVRAHVVEYDKSKAKDDEQR
jgi:hypothetical protein